MKTELSVVEQTVGKIEELLEIFGRDDAESLMPSAAKRVHDHIPTVLRMYAADVIENSMTFADVVRLAMHDLYRADIERRG